MRTPTPWWDESGIIHAKGPEWTPECHSCIHVAKIGDDAVPDDAAFIVLAVNNHDALVAALRAMRIFPRLLDRPLSAVEQEVLDRAESALGKAGAL